MEIKKKSCPTYTDLDRLSLLKSYFESGQNKTVFARKHGFTASSINYWKRRYGVSDLDSVLPLIPSEDMPSTEETLKAENRKLQQEIRRLQQELQKSKFRAEALDLMIDLAESTYKIPVRKNSGAK